MSEGAETSELSDSPGRSAASVTAEAREGFKWAQLGPKSIEIPEEWKRVRVRDVTELITRGKQPTYVDKPGIPVLNQSCIYWDGFHPEELRYLDEEVADSWKGKYFVERGDVLVNSTGQGTLGRALHWSGPSDEYALDGHITRIKTKRDEIDPQYLRHYLESTHGQTMLHAFCVAGSTGQIELSKADLLTMPLLKPPVDKQRRIAAVLSTVDEQIQQTEAVIETTEELKQGLAQELVIGRGLSKSCQEVSLGPKTVEVPTEWRVSTFSDVADIEKGSTPKTSNEAYYGGDIVWVTPADLSSLYERGEKYISNSDRKLTEAGLESTSVHIVEPNSVVFTSRSFGIGKTAICTVPAATNQGIIAFDCNPEIDEEYLYHYLNWIMDYIVSLSGVSTFPEVSKSDISNIPVPIPTEEDQQHIVEVLNRADEKVIREREYKQLLQELKRGLMQDLLTGTVRVPESIEVAD